MRRPVYYFTHLDGSFGVLSERFAASPGVWLPPPAGPLEGGGREVLLTAGDRLPAVGVTAEVRVAEPVETGDPHLLVRPLSWRARHAPAGFPVLNGDIELEWLAGALTRLAFAGSYRPPLSVVGAAADRVAGRHVAEAVVRRFVLGVGSRLQQAPILSA